jgi:hypothetical protein
MAIGMGWSWTFSLVLGWYFVGTQMKRSSIRNALKRARRYLETPEVVKENGLEVVKMTRIDSRRASHSELDAPFTQRNDTDDYECLLWGRFAVAGDEENPGPIFNYARIHTWQRIAVILIDAHNTKRRHDYDDPHDVNDVLADCNLDHPDWEMKLHHWSRNVEKQGDMTPGPPTSFKPTRPPGGAFPCFVIAVLFHFCTTLPAFATSYFTPTQGLGCRSAGYLLYFVLSFVSATTLACSSWLTKRWYWYYLETQNSPLHQEDSRFYDFVKFLAVATRISGKGVAYASSLWIILHCIFQSIGWYARCWCNCNVLILGPVTGYWVFLDATHLQNVVAPYWKGFTAESVVVMFVTTGILYLSSRKYRKSRARW